MPKSKKGNPTQYTANSHVLPNYIDVTGYAKHIAKDNDALYVMLLERYILHMESHIRSIEKSLGIIEQVASKQGRMLDAIRDAGVVSSA